MLTQSRSTRFLIFCFALASVYAQESGPVEFLQRQDLTGVKGGNLVVAATSDPSNFNRLLVSGISHAAVADRLSADLVHINRSTLELEPSLATRWEADKTGRAYTIHLRRGVRFSDGSPFTADDVVFSLQVLADPNVPSVIAGQVEIDGSFPTVTKIDTYTVRLAFQRPVGMGLRMFDSVPILPKSRLFKAYQEGRFASIWGPTVEPENVVGLGPFRLKEYQRGIRIVLERNPYYWKRDRAGQTLPYLDTITFLIIPDLNAEALRFQQGELDMANPAANSFNPGNYASLRRSGAEGRYTLRDLGPGLSMEFLWFNLNRGNNRSGKPYLDPEKLALFERSEFRRAISYALDREGMTRSILLGLGAPQCGPVSTGNKIWYDARASRTEHNPARARELLAQIGLKDSDGDGVLEFGSKKRPLDVVVYTSSGNTVREKLAQVVQDNLLKIGIRVGIQYFLPNEIASRFLNSFDYEAILFGFTPTDVAPDLQTDLWYSSGNIHFWCPNQKQPERPWEAEMDSLISRLVKSTDPAVRKTAFYQFQDLWAREMPAISTIAGNILVGWSNSVGNVRPSILTPHLLWNAEEITKRGPSAVNK